MENSIRLLEEPFIPKDEIIRKGTNRYKEKNLGGGETIRYLDVTPKMKEGTSKGQPLFAATPLLPATSLLDEEKRKEITSLLE